MYNDEGSLKAIHIQPFQGCRIEDAKTIKVFQNAKTTFPIDCPLRRYSIAAGASSKANDRPICGGSSRNSLDSVSKARNLSI